MLLGPDHSGPYDSLTGTAPGLLIPFVQTRLFPMHSQSVTNNCGMVLVAGKIKCIAMRKDCDQAQLELADEGEMRNFIQQNIQR